MDFNRSQVYREISHSMIKLAAQCMSANTRFINQPLVKIYHDRSMLLLVNAFIIDRWRDTHRSVSLGYRKKFNLFANANVWPNMIHDFEKISFTLFRFCFVFLFFLLNHKKSNITEYPLFKSVKSNGTPDFAFVLIYQYSAHVIDNSIIILFFVHFDASPRLLAIFH